MVRGICVQRYIAQLHHSHVNVETRRVNGGLKVHKRWTRHLSSPAESSARDLERLGGGAVDFRV